MEYFRALYFLSQGFVTGSGIILMVVGELFEAGVVIFLGALLILGRRWL